MSPEVTAAIIGAAATIFAAVIAVYFSSRTKDESKSTDVAQSTPSSSQSFHSINAASTQIAHPLSPELENFRVQLGLQDAHLSRYAEAQFQAYCDIWRVLQSLRLAGEDLWARASHENIMRFAQLLRETQRKVEESAIFFKDDHYKELMETLNVFGRFRIGKLRLYELRSMERQQDYINEEMANEQIAQNHIYKQHYEALLEKIRRAFKGRLSGI